MTYGATRKTTFDNIMTELNKLSVDAATPGNFRTISREEEPNGWSVDTDFPVIFVEHLRDEHEEEFDTFQGDAWITVFGIYVMVALGTDPTGKAQYTEDKQEQLFDRTGDVLNELSKKATMDSISEGGVWFDVFFDRERFGLPVNRIELNVRLGPEPN